MRIFGFYTRWPKFQEPEFTTFRLCRRDKDWQADEVVQVVYKPRSKEREILGVAEIIKKESRCLLCSRLRFCQRITTYEAEQDGFSSLSEMEAWMLKVHGDRVLLEAINKLTLKWVNKEDNIC